MAKYDPLASYLEGIRASDQTVDLSFAEVGSIVGLLPPSAFRHRAWWANDSKVEARALGPGAPRRPNYPTAHDPPLPTAVATGL